MARQAVDLNGAELKVGDTVMVPAVIVSIHENEDWCDITCETQNPPKPGRAGSAAFRFALNESQVVLFPVAEPETAPSES